MHTFTFFRWIRKLTRSRWTLLLGCTTLLAGCQSPSRTSSPDIEAVRVGREVRLDEAQVARFVAFQDGLPALQDRSELHLPDFITEVLRRNPTLAAAENTVRAALALHAQVTALDDPQLTWGAAPGSIGSSDVDFAQRIEISQRLPWPGKRKLQGEMVLGEADARWEELRTVRDRLVAEAKSAYFHSYLVHRAIEINDTNQAILREFRQVAETKYAAGTVSKQDALQAQVAHDYLRHQGIVLERMRRVAQGRLNTLLNRSPQAALPAPVPALELPRERPPLDVLVQRALTGRPELAELIHRLRAQEAARELARKESYPDLTLSAGYNSFWQFEDLRAMVGVGINLPIQRGARRGGLDRAAAEIGRLRAEIEERTSGIALEVQEAFELVVESEHVVELYGNDLVPATEENLDAARAEYAAGKVDFLSMLTAERSLMDAQLAYYEALAGYHQWVAELERTVGARPFEDLTGTSLTEESDHE